MKKKLFAAFVCGNGTNDAAAQAVLSGADGVIMQDVSETDVAHDAFMGEVRKLVRRADAPVISGGRVKRLEDIKKYLYAGSRAAYFSVTDAGGAAAVKEAADRFGADKLYLLASGTEPAETFREYAEAGITGLILSSLPEEGALSETLSGLFKEILVMSSGILSPEEILSKPFVTGCVISQTADGTDDFMALKNRLKRAGTDVSTFETDVTWADIKKDASGLLPVVVQDCRTDEVLMVAWMNEEAFRLTLERGRMTYWSRSRQELWLKGETSGHFQYVRSLTLDCDNDTLLAKVFQIGAACHTGAHSCFFNEVASVPGTRKDPRRILEDDYRVIEDRRAHPKQGSYTNYLFDKGIDKILKKVGEEATEIVIAAKNPDPEEIKYEIADFLYHAMVLMVERGVTWDDILQELANR